MSDEIVDPQDAFGLLRLTEQVVAFLATKVMIALALIVLAAIVAWVIWHYSKPYGGDEQW